MGIDNDLPNSHLFRVEEVPKEMENIVLFLQDRKALDEL